MRELQLRAFVFFLVDQTMKNLFLATIFVVIFCVNFSTGKLGNSTNTTNASIPTNSSSNATTVQLTRLYIGAFFDLGVKSGYGSLPMAQQAIDEINNNTEVLPGYQLELVVNSTQVRDSSVLFIC